MKYFVYKTTNIITNDYYIGKHETNNINDAYLGSGTILKLSIKKYGKENFIREILSYHSSSEDALLEEYNIISKHLGDEKCLNIVDGGGGFTSESGKRASFFARQKGHFGFLSMPKEKLQKIAKYAGKLGAKVNKNNNTGMWAMTFEQRSSWIKESNSNTTWITDGFNELRIKNNDIVPEGWVKGRTMIGSTHRTGMMSWTNGKINVFSFEQPDANFINGMTKTTPTAKMSWWNNGIINKRSFENPDGFIAGRLKWKSKTVTCPHCQKIGGETAMKRHHFENCKKRICE